MRIRLPSFPRQNHAEIGNFTRYNAAYHLVPYLLEPNSISNRNALRIAQAIRVNRALSKLKAKQKQRSAEILQEIKSLERANNAILEKLDLKKYFGKVDSIKTLKEARATREKTYFAVCTVLHTYLASTNLRKNEFPQGSIARAQRVADYKFSANRRYQIFEGAPVAENYLTEKGVGSTYYEKAWREYRKVAPVLYAMFCNARTLNPFEFKAVGKVLPEILADANAIIELLQSEATPPDIRERHFAEFIDVPHVDVPSQIDLAALQLSPDEIEVWLSPQTAI